MPKVGARQIGGGMNSWEIEFDSPVTAAQVWTFLGEQRFFGYHPSGYGGYLYLNGRHVPAGETPSSAKWQYKCWLSCD